MSSAGSLVKVGEEALLKGQFEKAYWAFDAELCLSLFPPPSPSCAPPTATWLWKRGLACFYAGHFAEGAQQFRDNMRENGSDVEEVLWNFLCRYAADGYQRAQADGLLLLAPPTREAEEQQQGDNGHTPDHAPIPPMPQVLELFEGSGSVEDILSAATPTDGSRPVVRSYNDTNALAYAHFYVGAYHEARGKVGVARRHLEAAARLDNPDFMGRLMAVHQRLFASRHPQAGGTAANVQDRLVLGGWQLSRGHRIRQGADDTTAKRVWSLLRAFDAGIRHFDCGDIYDGVEELYGRFLRAHRSRGGREDDIVIHTKFVPDLRIIQSRCVGREYVEAVVRRSLNRMGVSSLSLLQFHWWDLSVLPSPSAWEGGVVEAFRDLLQRGLVERIGLTNFSVEDTMSLLGTGIPIASTQVLGCSRKRIWLAWFFLSFFLSFRSSFLCWIGGRCFLGWWIFVRSIVLMSWPTGFWLEVSSLTPGWARKNQSRR